MKPVFLPTDDFTAATIDAYFYLLSDDFFLPNINNEQGAILRLMDKSLQKRIAVESGMNVAKEWICNWDNGSYQIPDGIAYPCDSIKYFTKLGVSGNIKENSLMEMYNSEYFTNIRKFNADNSCSTCEQYSICKSGCIGQKIIANYTESDDNVLTLKRCINSRDPKCMR